MIPQKTEPELRALLPDGVTEVTHIEALNLSMAPEAQNGPAFPTPERDLVVQSITKRRWRECRMFAPLGSSVKNVFCDNPAHTLMSRLVADPKPDVDFFEGNLAMNGVKGPMPAEFAYLTMPWPPTATTKRTDREVHLVCGFCASALSDGWAEAEAEAEGS